MWGATSKHGGEGPVRSISIHAPRVGSDPGPRRGSAQRAISIHAPRVGSDHAAVGKYTEQAYFNPRSPCGERPWVCRSASEHRPNFNPRSPCGERRTTPAPAGRRCPDFNPRSPCGERPISAATRARSRLFQSTLPVWGATRLSVLLLPFRDISIHAPRVGSDLNGWRLVCLFLDFNPRSPCGERPAARLRSSIRASFQSTLPVWGATKARRILADIKKFQSTLPVWGATPLVGSCTTPLSFQSTLPVWGATVPAQRVLHP